MIHKISSASGAGLPGAVFELAVCGGSACTGTTDANGSLLFCLLPCHTYALRELAAPAGYAPTDHVYHICVSTCGCILVDGAPTSALVIHNTPVSASFTAVKVNVQTGQPLAGAVYALFSDSVQIATAVSTLAGQLVFSGLTPGVYQLIELSAPEGFLPNPEAHTVVVAPDGSVTINGQPANGFILTNTPLQAFSFLKVDAATGLPLAGATFSLSQNGTVLGAATSGSDGVVTFGVLPIGSYLITEIVPPENYAPNFAVYQVIVAADGTITVNGMPLESFTVGNTLREISLPPIINTILEESPFVTGTGVPGSAIVVTMPNGATVPAAVGTDGTWSAAVPAGTTLAAGEVVSAVQTEPFKLPSAPVFSTVIGLIEPFLEKTFENLTNPGQPVLPGDTLLFTALVGNLGGVGSVWNNVVLSDVLIEDLIFAPGTVTVDGQPIPVGTGVDQYTYDATTRTLTIYLGNLAAGVTRAVAFQTTVGPDAAEEITNSITARSLAGNALTIAAVTVSLG